ncbi:neuronal regeneration-related protein isoform X1 [Zonotrichia albicollis]|uniref:neuronal regeneration-related protein isoform X1 n=1 Tax=Zonotrichia albicollis TaxID=44394 RepID=UPI003D80C7A1
MDPLSLPRTLYPVPAQREPWLSLCVALSLVCRCRLSLAALRTLCLKARPRCCKRGATLGWQPRHAALPCPALPQLRALPAAPARAARPLPALRGLPAHRLLPSQTSTADAKRRAGGCLRLPPVSSDALCRIM